MLHVCKKKRKEDKKMKKTVILMVVLLMTFTFVSAIYDPNATYKEGEKATKGAPTPALMMQQGEMQITNFDEEAPMHRRLEGEGELMTEEGKQLRFMKAEGERLRLQVGEHIAECEEECNLTQEGNKIRAMLSNGRNAEIKIMPDQAAERALERLRLKNCVEGSCTIELKEVGNDNETRMAYQIKKKAKARFLGIFPAKANVEAEIDAETGEVIKTKKPWFMSIRPETDETEEE
jgi:hypothetical protein